MSATGSFLVEEFINSITVQLDRVQDALRLKSINRPLTYALKDLSLDLQVFVELDTQGNVRFRNSAPNEAGASTVRLGFTTITKPMIEENTISMAVTRSPSLGQIGLEPDERKRLESLGVHNAAQLQNLYSTTGGSATSRLSDVPIDRLRQALQLGKPKIREITPAPPVASTPPAMQTTPPSVIRVTPSTPNITLRGSGLIGAGVRLNREALSIAHADDDRMVVDLPESVQSGALEVTLPDGDTMHYRLEVQPHNHIPNHQAGQDRWEPAGERM